MPDDNWSRLRTALTPNWDHLRETRLLGRVLEGRRRESIRRRRWRVALGAGLVVAAAAGVGLSLAPRARQPDTPPPSALRRPAPEPVTESVLTFAEGSRALLAVGAQVHAEKQSERAVALRQTAGRVRYEVKPDPARVFEVQARGVRIQVIGTVFTVEVLETGVGVRVLRGRVRVLDGERNVELGPDENLSIIAPPPKPPSSTTASTAAAPDAPTPAPPPTSAPAAPSAAELLAKADAARQTGRLSEAAQALRQLLSTHKSDARTVSVWFTLGRVERSRGHHAEAAQAFHSAWARAPGGTLAEDALAEEAISWSAAGSSSSARRAAQSYLARYPRGSHAERMQRLLD